MPRPYNEAVMTTAGAILLDRVRAGLATIEFTRMAAGDGTYTEDEKSSSALQECTGLKSSRNNYALSSVSTVPGGGVKLTALFTDQDPVTGEALVSEGYYINEIGLYAKEKDADDSTEVLYSITVAAGDIGDYMPAYTGSAPVQIVQEYRARVSDAETVSINSSGAVMLAEDAQKEFASIRKMIEGTGGGPIEDETPVFEQAEERENITSGDSLGTILGKIERSFADLKGVAFTGSYDDLSDTPDAPTVVQATIMAAGWTGEDVPYENTVAVEGVTTESIVEVTLQARPTEEQVTACAGAMLVDGGQADGSITLMAMGDKPEVDLPVTVIIR